MFYLQDISVQFLEEEHDNPIAALNKLVTYFEEKLSINGKKYDRSAIKFYLVNEMIKCRVFPNERSEYDAGKQQCTKIFCNVYWLSHTQRDTKARYRKGFNI